MSQLGANDRILVATGGSRGLGRAAVLAMAKRGIHSIFTYVSNKKSAEDVIKQIQQLGAQAIALHLDVSQPDTIDAFVIELKKALAIWGRDKFDYLLNNAGVASHGTVEKHKAEELDNSFNIHYKSVFLLTQKTLPLINDKTGRIINISTGLTRFTNPGFVIYASMKSAIEVYTKYLAKELGPRGITVLCVAPGATETDFGGGSVRDNKEVNQMLSKMTAAGRLGQPEEIGAAIGALFSDDCRWINGTRVEVSGGQQI